MKPRYLVSLLAGICLVFGVGRSAWAATAVTLPDEFPNGATETPDKSIHTRLEITLTGAIAIGTSTDIEVTPPTGVSFRTDSRSPVAFVGRSSGATVVTTLGTTNTASQLDFEMTNGGAAGEKIIIEFDVITDQTLAAGATTFGIVFPNDTGENTTAAVTLRQNQRITFIDFSSPSGNDDTTSAEGTAFKITFASLPDLVHDDNTSSSTNPNGSNQTGTASNDIDDADDFNYKFWASTDSGLVKTSDGGQSASILTRKRTPTSASSYSPARDGGSYTEHASGLFQSPTTVKDSLVTENFTSRFADSNLEGLVDTRGFAEGIWFIYIYTDKTSEFFLGRSDSLVVEHAPGFLGAAWDRDNSGSDAFSSNSIVQTTVDDAGSTPDDAQNMTLDSGQLFDQDGNSASSEVDPAASDSKTNVDLIFNAVDYDDSGAKVAIFISTNSGLTESDLVTSGPDIDKLTGATQIVDTDTLSVGSPQSHNFQPENAVSVNEAKTDTATLVAGSYTVYFAGFDGTNKTVEKAFDINAATTKTTLTLTVRHSPQINVDPLQFDQGSAGNLNVNTGVTSATAVPQRFLSISWEQNGLDGIKSVEDSTAEISFYYSDDASFTTATTMLADIGTGDTHKIGTDTLTNEENKFNNHLDWDLWTFVSTDGGGGTITAPATAYTIYATVKSNTAAFGDVERLVRFHDPQSSPVAKTVTFTHDSFIKALLPAKDVTVGPDDPVVFTWEAVDVDNAGGSSSGTGLTATNSTSTSPDIMIILSDADEGATTTRATLNAAGHYVANSRDGDDVTPGTTTGVIRLHEGVDTSFVFVANRLARDMANNLTSIPAATYFPYILINGNAQEIGAAPFVNDADIAYRYPGKIILSSAGGAQPTNARFIFPTQIKTSSGEMLRIPIVAEDGGVTVAQMDIFVSVDTTYFEAVDKDPSTAGVQPYTLGANAALSSGNIIGNMIDTTGATLELDFTYRDASGVTFLDGVEILANLHLKAKDLSGTANTTVTLDNNPGTNRQTSLYLTAAAGGTRISTTIPGPSAARIDPRGSIAGTVPLQGRADWTMPAAEVAFFLRKSSIRGATAVGTAGQAGGFETLDDSVFEAANDSTSNLGGVNVSIPSSGAFTLSSVPAGDYTLVVFVDRYLAGQREVTVEAGEAVTGVQPTVNGLGQDQGQLLAGDAAGYDHDGLAATNTRPDNFIDSSDESAITAAFGAETGDSLYDAYPFADVNGSGEVDGVDLNFSTVNTTTINGTNDPVKPTFNLSPPPLRAATKTPSSSWPNCPRWQGPDRPSTWKFRLKARWRHGHTSSTWATTRPT